MNIQHDQNKGRHADGQAEYVDKGSDFISPKDSEGDDQKTS